MVVKVSGKIDGKEVIFERAEGDRWNATVPYDLDGMYVVELTAENDAGNIAWPKQMQDTIIRLLEKWQRSKQRDMER